MATILLPMMRAGLPDGDVRRGLDRPAASSPPSSRRRCPFRSTPASTDHPDFGPCLSGHRARFGMGAGLIHLLVLFRDRDLPGETATTADRRRLRSTGKQRSGPLMPMIIIGGMKSGVFTPTEAAVVAAFYALVIPLFGTPRTVRRRPRHRPGRWRARPRDGG